jgi:hypothetical protein
MFKEIDYVDLVDGKKYVILTKCRILYHTAIFSHSKTRRTMFDQLVVHLEPHVNITDKEIAYFTFISQKEQIQQDMEKRALDKILKRLINDDFSW